MKSRDSHRRIVSESYLSSLKRTPKPKKKIARTAPKNFLNNWRALHNKTRLLRRIAPESSPETSAKSLSKKFFGVPFLFLIIVAIRIASVCWSSSPPKTQDLVLIGSAFVRCDSNRAIGVHWCSTRSTWNCGLACESWPCSLNTSDGRLAIGDWRFGPSKQGS